MKKFLLTLIVTMLACIGAWAQSVSFDTSTPGTLKIKASGDLTNYTITDEVTTTVFTDAAEGNIFTGTASNTGVTAGDVYNPLSTYYLISDDINFGEALNSGKPADGNDNQYFSVATSKAAKSAYAGYKILNAYYYNGWTISDGEWQIGNLINQNADQGPSGGFYRAVLVSEGIASGTNIGDATDGVINYDGITAIPLSPSNWTDYFEEVTTITPKSGANLYVSINDGEKVGKSSAFLWEDDMSIYNATLGENVLITDNAAYFGETGEGAAFITDRTTPLDTDFKTALATMLNSGSYTTVVFEQNGGAITIDTDIIKRILYPNSAANPNIVTLDLGGTTCKDLQQGSFALTGSTHVAANMNLTTLTLPMATVADEMMTMPTQVLDGLALNTNKKLTNIIIPEGYTHIGTSAFTTLVNITDITLPTTLKVIGTRAFEGNTSLVHINKSETRSFNFPDGLEEIGEYAFSNCYVPQTGAGMNSTPDDPIEFKVPIIRAAAFAGINGLKYIIFREGVKFIGNSAFALSGSVDHTQTAMTFPNTVEYIGPNAFNFRYYDDIYFKSTIAPTCPIGCSVLGENYQVNAFYEQIHMGNDGFVPVGATGGAAVTGTADKIADGYANRENYINGDKYFTILHFPSDLTPAQAETYTDITRVYKTKRNADGSFNQNEMDTPGKGDVKFSTDLAITYTMPNAKNVNVGYEDTYAGSQKIWPSQMQWMRSYACNFNGYKWDGVTEYRPEVTQQMIDWMIFDNLKIKVGENTYVYLTDNTTLTEDQANAYNETIEDAVKTGSPKSYYEDQTDVNTKNASLPGAVTAGNHNYTQEQADAYNAKLEGAVSTETVKEPAVEGREPVYYGNEDLGYPIEDSSNSYDKETLTWVPEQQEIKWTADELATVGDKTYDKTTLDFHEQSYYSEDELNQMQDLEKNNLSYDENGYIKPAYYTTNEHSVEAYTWQDRVPYVAAHYELNATSKKAVYGDVKVPGIEAHGDIYYTQQQANEKNATLQGAKTISDTYTLTEEEATAYNNALPNAVKIGDVKETYTQEDAIAQNRLLPNAKTAGSTLSNVALYMDQLSKDAYQGTRRFVLGDGDTNPTPEYPLDIKGAKWWTICVPFNMTKKMVDETFGEGTHVCLFSKVERDATSAQKSITLYFQNDVYNYKTERTNETTWDFAKTNPTTDADDIVIWAHEAYMIRPTKDSSNPADYAVQLYRPLSGGPKPTIVLANDGTEYRFVGNYEKNLAVEDASGDITYTTKKIPLYSYMYALKKGDTDSKFWFNTSTKLSWAPNKCVVQATAKDGGITDNTSFFGSNTNKAKQTSIFGDDDDATEIENVVVIAGEGNAAEVVYSINGQIVNKNAMRPGIYIKNGKKFIAR